MRPDPGAPALTVLARVRSGSNAVFRCVDDAGTHWVYKPIMGERPLRDFPRGTLAAREVATGLVASATGWDVVPETLAVVGPGGPGMAQVWVEERPETPDSDDEPVGVWAPEELPRGVIPVLAAGDDEGHPLVVGHRDTAELRRMSLLDHVVNNADRKGGHLLVDTAGRVRGIDHGLTFHTDPKVRTVLWGWAGAPIDEDDLTDLRTVADRLADGDLGERLAELLSTAEVAATTRRLDRLLAEGVHPVPETDFPLPWPLF